MTDGQTPETPEAPETRETPSYHVAGLVPTGPAIVTSRFDQADAHTYDGYVRTGGYSALRRAVTELTPEQVHEEVKAAEGRSKRGDIETYFFDKLTHQSIVVDWRDARPGDKQYHWEQRGVPFRIEIGPRDVDGNATHRDATRGRLDLRLDGAGVFGSPGPGSSKLDPVPA